MGLVPVWLVKLIVQILSRRIACLWASSRANCITSVASLTLLLFNQADKLGPVKAARIPIIAKATKISNRVKP